MLVLSRKKDESIVINNDITIVVVEIRGDKVRLGVEAPKEVPVHRQEVFDAIARGETVVESVEADSQQPVLQEGFLTEPFRKEDSVVGDQPHAG
jgi:carbon storage regulator